MLKLQTSVSDVVIPHKHKDLIAHLRSINVNIVPKSENFTKMCFTKCAHLQPQQYHRGKPKQAHQIVLPEHYDKPYQNTHKHDNDDEFLTAFQLCAQPQRSIHNQRVNISYAQKHLYANIQYQLKPYHKHNRFLCIQLDTCANVSLMPEVCTNLYSMICNQQNWQRMT